MLVRAIRQPREFSLFAENVRYYRVALNLSMTDFAQRSGIGLNTLTRVQRGCSCTLRTQHKIANVLNVSLEQLWGPRGDKAEAYFHYDESNSRWAFGDRDDIERWPINMNPGEQGSELIQNEHERHRVGRNGYSRLFLRHHPGINVGAPGSILVEIFSCTQVSFREREKYCTFYCIRGTARFKIGDEEVILDTNDVLSLRTDVPTFVEPLHKLGKNDLPPLLFGTVVTVLQKSGSPSKVR
jgi:transcriptional regulator with XRE-family HTH domain